MSGAFDLADGQEITPSNVTCREYHHLFPMAYLSERGIDEFEASNALNCALVTWRTNRTIAAKEPLEYLRDRVEASSLGEADLRNRLPVMVAAAKSPYVQTTRIPTGTRADDRG